MEHMDTFLDVELRNVLVVMALKRCSADSAHYCCCPLGLEHKVGREKDGTVGAKEVVEVESRAVDAVSVNLNVGFCFFPPSQAAVATSV